MVKRASNAIEQLDIQLPEGVTVIQRPPEIELMTRSRNKWLPYAMKVERLIGTDTLSIPLGDVADMANSKTKINSIRMGLRKAWCDLKHKPSTLKFYVKGNALWIWANQH